VGTSSFEDLKTASANSTGSTIMTVSKCSRMFYLMCCFFRSSAFVCGELKENLWMRGDGKKGRREVIRDEEKVQALGKVGR
jgi:hypothetical protein